MTTLRATGHSSHGTNRHEFFTVLTDDDEMPDIEIGDEVTITCVDSYTGIVVQLVRSLCLNVALEVAS